MPGKRIDHFGAVLFVVQQHDGMRAAGLAIR
jgi:hypothetical protein